MITPFIRNGISQRLPNRAIWSLSDKIKYFMRAVPHALAIISSIPNETNSRPKGLLVSSFNSVTISPIPYISFNIKVPSSTFDAIQSSKHFIASVIDDRATANAFAKTAANDSSQWEKMLGLDGKLKDGHGGVVWMRCKWVERQKIEVADHVIVIGEVLEAGKYQGRELEISAMVHWQGKYRGIGRDQEDICRPRPD
ncbi:MAG: hypothetical protein Q9217_000070 [Psora testacea]